MGSTIEITVLINNILWKAIAMQTVNWSHYK